MAKYPQADTTTQWFGEKYPGSKMTPNVVVWHTTETGTWPGYGGGSSAPTFTIKPDVKRKRLVFRQHFQTDRSARALRNLAGGVETNTLNVVQVELVGTCSTVYRDKYGYFYWPDAPEWALRQLAEFMAWLHRTHPDYPLADAAPRGWKPYPSSYANGAGQRMTFAEWRRARGNVGHQHVPENVHGDPGDLDMHAMVKMARAILDPKKPAPPKKPEQGPPTKVQRARALLHEAREQALAAKNTKRAERLQHALDNTPKR